MMILFRRYPGAGLLLGGVVVVAFGAVLSVLAPVTARAPDKDAIAKGRTTYERYCVSCHGPQARGNGPLARELRVEVPDLTLLSKRAGGAFPSDRVFDVISKGSAVRGHGTDDMPAWGTAFNRTAGTEAAVDEAIRQLVAYIETLQRAR